MAKRKSASSASSSSTRKSKRVPKPKQNGVVSTNDDESSVCEFVGEPIEGKSKEKKLKVKDDSDANLLALKHYKEANVYGVMFKIGDDAYVEAEKGEPYICRIVEFFKGEDGLLYFTAQWFYRAKETDIGACHELIEEKRVFLSEVRNDNPLGCLLNKLTISQLPLDAEEGIKNAVIDSSDFYYDMKYLVPYSSFVAIPGKSTDNKDKVEPERQESKTTTTMNLLDLYCGCGGMSSGLCMGANISGVHLVTRWAVDYNEYACESMKLNHPETEVRFEKAENYLELMKRWESVYNRYLQLDNVEEEDMMDEEDVGDEKLEEGVYEVDKILAVRYFPPEVEGNSGIEFKVRWERYGPEDDSWEPEENLKDCAAKVKEFVISGYKSKLVPLPGDVDVICGGPPCQGISGYNRFRNPDEPLQDTKNYQLVVFMKIVEFLRPRFVLLENVVDMLKFSKGYMGRFGLGSLVGLNYQVRIGILAAGAYGLPQYRMRMFMWGACHSEILPQYPLPTHHADPKGNAPVEFKKNVVAYDDEDKHKDLKKGLVLDDAISDLPPVKNDESHDEMSYLNEPKTDFQKFIRLPRSDMPGFQASGSELLTHELYDHRPYKMNEYDLQRTCLIPKQKGANFRDLQGLTVVGKKVELDPNVERIYLDTKKEKPLVPNYAIDFTKGKSEKPFGRLWGDEIVPTVVTRPEPHNQKILHPNQDRVLTIRENARLQGFPDYYKLVGPVKERYTQVGNAVATPVARALGYSLGIASKRLCGDGPLLELPTKFPDIVKKAVDE